MRYKRFSPLIADSGYDVSVTRMDGRDFHAYTPAETARQADPSALGSADEFPWLSRGAVFQFTNDVQTATPILLADNYRNLLIFQNNSTADITIGDIPPTLYVNVDAAAHADTGQYAFALAGGLTPGSGVGLVLDTRVLLNSIYVAFDSGSGATTVFAGRCTYGRTPNSPPLSPQAAAAIVQANPQTGVNDPSKWRNLGPFRG
jgi:hypothetical protein